MTHLFSTITGEIVDMRMKTIPLPVALEYYEAARKKHLRAERANEVEAIYFFRAVIRSLGAAINAASEWRRSSGPEQQQHRNV